MGKASVRYLYKINQITMRTKKELKQSLIYIQNNPNAFITPTLESIWMSIEVYRGVAKRLGKRVQASELITNKLIEIISDFLEFNDIHTPEHIRVKIEKAMKKGITYNKKYRKNY